MRLNKIIWIIGFLVLVSFVHADPTIITLQGKLTDDNDAAIQTASFRINVTDNSNVHKWGPFTFNNTVDSNGVFNIPLGAVDTLSLTPGNLYKIILEIDDGSNVFSSADVIFGDANPSTDLIKFTNGLSGRPTFQGTTTANYTGTMGGWLSANSRCNADFPGSHICTNQDVIESGRLTNVSQDSWIYHLGDQTSNCNELNDNASKADFNSSSLDNTANVGEYASMVFGNDGFARISYFDTTTNAIKYIQCRNQNCSSNVITTINNASDTGWTDIAIGNDSLPRITFRGGSSRAYYVRCENANCTSNVTTNIGIASATRTRLAIANDGTARIVRGSGSSTNMDYVQCLDDNCSSNNAVTIATTSGGERYHDIAIGNDGFARISYYNDTSDTLNYIQCQSDDCTSRNNTIVDDTAANVGEDTSIAIGNDGFARIAYKDVTNLDLKYVQCLNDNCSENNKTIVEDTDNAGDHTSIVIGHDGFARIGYQKSTGSDLKYAQCLNDACTSSIVTIAQSTGSAGLYASIDIADNGFIAIAHYDGTSTDLRYTFRVGTTGNVLNKQGRPDVNYCYQSTPIACCR